MKLYSLNDVASVLQVSRQRVHKLSREDKLPEPLGITSAGRIWDAAVIDDFAVSRNRKPGRPRNGVLQQ